MSRKPSPEEARQRKSIYVQSSKSVHDRKVAVPKDLWSPEVELPD